MRVVTVSFLSLVIATLTPSISTAQAVASTQVTLTVPVDLTQLGPELTKVRVDCTIRSEAITNGNQFKEVAQQQEIAVSGGAVKTNASLVFSLTNLDNPVGKSADVTCMLSGWSQSAQRWAQFHTAQTDPSFRTSTDVGVTKTTFVW